MIRPATRADLDAVVAMSLAFIASTPYHAVLTPNADLIRATAATFVAAGDKVILVADGTFGLTGMIALVAYQHPFTGQYMAGEVVWWVDPAHRGQGGRLMLAAEQWAKTQGVSGLQMIAPTHEVETLYEKRGYRPVERTYLRTWACS